MQGNPADAAPVVDEVATVNVNVACLMAQRVIPWIENAIAHATAGSMANQDISIPTANEKLPGTALASEESAKSTHKPSKHSPHCCFQNLGGFPPSGAVGGGPPPKVGTGGVCCWLLSAGPWGVSEYGPDRRV